MSLRMRLASVFALGSGALVMVAGLAFLWQLHTSLRAALDSELRLRTAALAARMASGSLPARDSFGSNQAGSHAGQFPAAQEVSQVLTARGLVVYSSGTESAAPLLSRGQLRQAAAGPLTSTAVVEGERLRIMATDLRFRSHWVIAVVAVPTDIADTALARARLALLIGAPLAVLMTGLGGWLLTGVALDPVTRMRRLEEITGHDTDSRLPVPATGDEIAALVITMNGLLERLQLALARRPCRPFGKRAIRVQRRPVTRRWTPVRRTATGLGRARAASQARSPHSWAGRATRWVSGS
jgi:two-component system, OmpR family, sensor kinase